MTSLSKQNLLLQQATTFHQDGQLDLAESIYQTLLLDFPHQTALLTNLGTISLQRGNYAMAVEWFDQSLEKSFQQPIALNNRGNALTALERYTEALSSFNCAISIDKVYVEAYFNRGNTLQIVKDFKKSLESYDKAVSLNPDYAEAYLNRGVVLNNLEIFDDAIDSFNQALRCKPNFAEAYFNRGNSYTALLKFDIALDDYNQAITCNPDYVEAHTNKGNILRALNHFDDALFCYQRVIEINPASVDAYYNQGNIFFALLRFEEALVALDQAISFNAEFVEVLVIRGQVLRCLGRSDQALDSYDKAIIIEPTNPEHYLYRGHLLTDLRRLEEAQLSYTKSIELDPDYAEAYYNRGITLSNLTRNEEALADYECALKLAPYLGTLPLLRLGARMYNCFWDDFTINLEEIIEAINTHNDLSNPFMMQALTDRLSVHKKIAQQYVDVKFPVNTKLPPITPYAKHNKIRIAYVSADFKNHPVAHLSAELYDLHDRNQFEVIAFSIGLNIRDFMRVRFEASFDHLYDVQNFSDEEVALLARVLEIDIIVDLTGHTQFSRTGIFAYRAAPIQVNYLGYPGTLGADYIDYIIADNTIIPEDKKEYYVEKVVYMPDSYMVTDSQLRVPDSTLTRESVGLPSKGFVFCCFNQTYKILPEVFSIWMRLLNSVQGSVLWLPVSNSTAIKNLKAEAVKQGVAEDRLIFAPHMPSIEDHLNRLRLADLFLDTLPFNAHTTASDALRMGLPVLTCMGESFTSRVAASLLNAVKLPELITTNPTDYEALAIDLATHPEKLSAIKAKLLAHLPTAPLYNTPLFTQHLESAYKTMVQRYHDGLTPDHIVVEH